MMQPAAIKGAVEKPNSSAPSSAPTTTSRPVRIPPSTCTEMRPRSRLATFPGLGALRHLDLHHVRVDEIFRRHAEAAGGNLLDGRAHGIAVRQGLEAIRLLAAFAGIGLSADAVHGDGERGMRFARDRAERHGASGETAHNAL